MANRVLRFAASPFATDVFGLDAENLKSHWKTLHAGDLEPWPDAKRAAALLATIGKPRKGLHANSLADTLQEAWLAFHQGNFANAYKLGRELGALGASVAIKALGIHASHLVDDQNEQLARFEHAIALAEDAVKQLPDEANSHYRLAYALGRYSQGISVAKALSMGLAGRVHRHLERCLELAPKHAEAHLAMAVYHAELIAKVGSLVAGLTYGAKVAHAEAHIAQALKLCPKMPVAHCEHAHVQTLLHGRRGEAEARKALQIAAALQPRDAMDWFDRALAERELG